MNQTIGTDYAATQQTLKAMNEDLTNIVNETKKLVQAIQERTDWQGADAVRYKQAFLEFAEKMAKTCAWMEALDNTISAHSADLYNRSLEDASKAGNL